MYACNYTRMQATTHTCTHTLIYARTHTHVRPRNNPFIPVDSQVVSRGTIVKSGVAPLSSIIPTTW